ncbi:endonuclease/exonuclease/phosphatase family protein [Streptomyces sp. NBC_00094]|uniref:endonuclease/exonuclease/phosphatase family protein n=1 Tax=Streptomyces sp. NBC_00094 TaxID=2903620 RepID=UPI00224FC90B|nr:endonuclease/exonuclease/phosphatase family protein [Streptomyces sp. NBC_00094]MCX5391750.1 endonuclease/exonuclease/phosphatase family protein [Streptomyces sp. NBC_00094]
MDRALTVEPVTNDSPTAPEPPPLRPRHRLTAWAAGLLLVVPALLAGCRTLDTDGVTPVPQLLSLLPWFTVPAGLAVLLAAVARRRALTFTAVVVLAAVGWSSLPYMPQLVTAYGLPLTQVRVLAANVEFGQATGALTEAIRRERPQLVFVSECDRACGHALTTAFAAELPHHASVDADGSVGSVLLSAYPLTDERVIPAVMGMPGATAEIAGVPVRLQLAHPLPPMPDQVDLWKRELGRIANAARHRTGPLLVAGDFNASQDHAAFRSILDSGNLQDAARLADVSRTPTWPMEGPLPPFVQIDHVLVTEDFSVRGIRFLDLAGSDHRAVLTDLDLRGGR